MTSKSLSSDASSGNHRRVGIVQVFVLLAACIGASYGCLDIHETPAAPDAGTDSGGAPGAGGAGFHPDACVSACLTGASKAIGLFSVLGACYESERGATCGAQCDPAAPADPASSSCPIPGIVDPNPGCNACLKDTCCDELQACLVDSGCLNIALCSANCQ